MRKDLTTPAVKMTPKPGLTTLLIIAVLLHIAQCQQTFQPEPYLLFANSIDIRRLNFDGTNYQTIVNNLQNVVALDFDYATGYIYWSDHINRKIQRAKMDDPVNIEDFVTANLTQPDGIALDWVSRILFFSDSARGVIEKINLDADATGQRHRRLHIGNNVHKPRGLCVDPHSDWLYFTDVFEVYPTIQKARISDGSQQTTLIDTGLSKPNAITIDYIERMLYWADAETDKVERCDLNGGNRQLLVDNPQRFHPYGLSQYEDRIYWTDQNLHHIVNVHKNNGEDKVIITGYFTYPTAIHVVHPDRQLGADIDACQANNGRGECDHICIDMYGGYTCLCRHGYTIQTDEHSCEDTNECSIGNGGCSHHCENTDGSFQCTCINGYTLQADGRTCVDTNECHISNGGCQFSCQNTESSYFCSCPSGYSLNADQITCYDDNECLISNPCPPDAQCRNLPGSYQCICPAGNQYNSVTGLCEDTNECTSSSNPCTQRCINVPGTFRCGCNEGFQLQDDGITCVDINECGTSNDCEGECTNVQGSYVCSCTVGYILNPDKKSCRPAVCSQPPDITGFSLECSSGYAYLSRCDVSCNYGTLVGSNHITCLSNSQWSVLTAECIGAPPKTENEPPILTYLTSNVIAEDADHGEVVGYLRTIDSDITQTFTYYLRGDAGPFYIGTDSTLRARGGLDFETQSQYSISILATDNGIPQQSQISVLTIYLIDINEPPGPPMWTQNSISENAKVGDVVSYLTAVDPDNNQQLNFTLITNSGGKFSITGSAIVVNRPLDYETNAVHQVHIQVRDNGSPILTNSAVFEIVVNDENEPPTKINFVHSDINEYYAGGDTLTGKVIGQFETEDPDQGDTHIYSILNSNNCFAVQGQNLVVNNADCFDFETHPFFLLNIQAMDSGGMTTRTTIRVNLADVNEPPERIVLSTTSVTEHVPINTVIGTLSAIDPDAGDTHTFSLVNSDSPFYIDGHSVKVAADISYETYPNGISFDVRCLDSGSNTIVETLVVRLLNKNEAPNDISVTVFKPCSPGHVGPNNLAIDACVAEMTVSGDIIALVEATDPDGDDLVITMIDSSDRFILTDDNKIIMGNDGVNYEGTTSYGHIYQITLTSMDPNGLMSEKDLTFQITDVNDVPSGIRTSATVVSSATPTGQNFAVLTCLDEDVSDTHTFTLVDNSGGRFAVSGNHLQVAAPLDRELTHTRTIVVKCSDGQAESDNVQIDLQVTASSGSDDIEVVLDDHSVQENSPVGTVVGRILATSTEADDTFEFDLLNSGEGVFLTQVVDTKTVYLVTNQQLDYEDDDTYTITVQVTGNYGTTVKSFTISVADVQEAPYNLALHNSVVQENINNALVGIVTAEDPEGDAIDFEITQDVTNAFQLLTTGSSNTKRLVTKRPLDYETEQIINVAIRAREQTTPDRKASEAIVFAIRVTDVNEAPDTISLNMNLVDENSAPGTVVSYIEVSDPDSKHHLQHFTCTLKDDANAQFALDGLSIVVAPDAHIDLEGPYGTELSVDLECQDQYGLSIEDRFTIAINNVNEPPIDILSASGLFQVKENSPGEVVAHLRTYDPDNSPQDTFTYTVSPVDFFAVMNDQLITHTALNYEEKSTHVVNLTTTDEGGLTLTKVITVEVIDTNDAPSGIAIPAGTTIDEHSEPGTLVAELSTIDEDVGQLYSYTIEAQSPLNALKLVDGNKLMVNDGDVINHEKVKTINVTLISRDNGIPDSLFTVQSLTITVLNVNEPPRSITLAHDTIYERSKDGSLVGEIYVDDPDSINQAFQCVLVADSGNRFELEHNGTTIKLLVGNGFALDYETVKFHDIIVECHDSDLQSPVTGSFRIHVLNANDPPSGVFLIDAAVNDTTLQPNRPEEDDELFGNVITSSVVTVLESAQAGTTIVAYVFVTDEDNQNKNEQRQEHFCHFISESEYQESIHKNSRVRRESDDVNEYSDEIPTEFMIQTGTNSILVREELNFEDKNEYMVYMECVDNGNPAMSTVNSVKIIVLDVDEAPIDIGLSTLSMKENSAEDALVATIGLVDPDGTQTAYAFEIISLGVPFYIKQQELRVARTPIDHEETPIWTVQIRVREVNTDLAIVKNFDIVIEPVNEAPNSLTINGDVTVNVIETLPVGSEVGTLETRDPDEDDTEFTYSFHGDSSSFEYFNIVDDKLVIAKSLNAWDMDVHELMIQVADPGGLTYVGKITVTLTEVNQCFEDNYCSSYAQCIHNVCTCKPGFIGNGFTCTDVDDCDPNPCNPDNSIGECQNGFGGVQNFTCTCKEGWLGPDCHWQIDDCVNNTCDSSGTEQCVDKLNGYDCQCRRGYTGQYCETNIDDCAVNKCENGGHCVDAVNGYTCNCVEPYIGVNCETDGTTCMEVTCPHNGTCIPYPASTRYACRCLEPFSPDCEGCMYGYGGPNCEPCKPPLTGVNCEVDGSVCTPNPCFGGGICVPYRGGKYTCICAGNFTGPHCELLNGINVQRSSQNPETRFPLEVIYIIIGVVALLVLIAILVCFLVVKRRRVLSQKRQSSHAKIRYDPNRQRIEMGPEFQDMEGGQGREIHDLENPTFFDFEEMVSAERAQEHDEQARAHMASIANRPVQNPKNNIVSVKVTNDLRAEFNNQGARSRAMDEAEERPRTVTDGQTVLFLSSKNNLGDFESRNLDPENSDDDDLKKDFVVDLPPEAVAFQNPGYADVEPSLGGTPQRQPEDEVQENADKNTKRKPKSNVKELARKFQRPSSGLLSSQQLTKDNPVYESDSVDTDDEQN